MQTQTQRSVSERLGLRDLDNPRNHDPQQKHKLRPKSKADFLFISLISSMATNSLHADPGIAEVTFLHAGLDDTASHHAFTWGRELTTDA